MTVARPSSAQPYSRGSSGQDGYLSYGDRYADRLFEIVSRRYETKSPLLTTNRPFSEWSQVFPNATCVVSLIDRIIHYAEILAVDGESDHGI